MKNFIYTITTCFLILVLGCSKDNQIIEEPEIPKFNVVILAGEGGIVNSSGGTFSKGSTITISAIPNQEFEFEQWSDGSTENPRELIVTNNINLTAIFKVRKYALTININGEGTVDEEILVQNSTPSEYESGKTIRLTAIPSDCWEFTGWSGDIESNENPIEIVITSSTTLNLSFNEIPIREIAEFNSISYESRSFYNRSFKDYLENGDALDAVVLDYNMDGFIDFVHTDSEYGASFNGVGVRNKIKFFKGDCNGQLVLDETLTGKFDGLEHGRKGIVGDYNNDGYPDIFFVGHGIDANPYPGEYPILLINEGGSDFKEERFENLIGFFHTTSSGDYDNDGDQDIILISQGVTYILKNDGNATFNIIKDDINYDSRAVVEFEQAPIVPLMNQIYTSELFDVNSDGYLDLIVTGHDFPDQYSGESAVLFGDGSTFLNGYKTLPSSEGYGIGVDIDFYDINLDGTLEIIVNRTGDPINGLGFYTGWKIQILELVGGNYVDATDKFIDESSGVDSSWMYWLHIDDFDNDGVIELFNDDLKTEAKSSVRPYKVWDLVNGKFILQTTEE